MSALAGRLIAGRYRIEALIGRGGMADVYRGSDTVLDRPVAIKILTDRSATVLRRFLREAQSMARLNHRNIVAVYDAGESDGFSFIVMEYIVGRTLGEIPADDLTLHVAIRYFIDLLEALAYAHEAGIIHRDIKPANIMVTADGTVKVMDFGMSRRTTELSNETNAGEIVGTIAYLAPERFLGKTADARSDLYAVGMVMYEVFAGRQPFARPDEDLVAMIFAHVNETAPSLRSINRAVPAQIDKLVLTLLAKEPDARIQTAREVIGQLQALIGGGPAAGPAAATEPPAAMSLPAAAAATEQDGRRNALDRSTGKATALNVGYSHTLAGMLAARKRDYPEAIRTYTLAMRTFADLGNDVEHAKAAIKYGAMILDKNSQSDRPEGREVDDAAKLIEAAAMTLRAHRLFREFEDGQQLHRALQRLGLRLR
jgi:serine/threonine-protein kinase